jgi:protein-S-isoprenylcysteine O-methyltransferase Ste14
MADVMDTTARRLWWRHALSFLVAPLVMTVLIPQWIATSTGVRAPDLSSPARVGLAIIGGLLIVVGLSLFAWTNRLFDRTGKGTLGIGKLLGEPVLLVVRGPYRHVRNPMITGVVCILLAEAAITASTALLIWAVSFFAVLAVVIRGWEEPHLEKRYGAEYVEYRRNVPAWIPRLSAWNPHAALDVNGG